MLKWNFRKTLIAAVCLFASFASAVSAWSFMTYSNLNTGISLTASNDNRSTVTINVRKQSATMITTTKYYTPTMSATDSASYSANITGWSEATGSDKWAAVYKDTTQNTSDSGNSATHGQKHSVGQIVEEPSVVSETTTTSDTGAVITETTYKRKTVYQIGETYLYTKYAVIKYYTWWYLVQTELRKEIKTVEREAPSDIANFATISVKTGGTIREPDLSSNSSLAGYKNYGFYADENYTQPFDFTKPITQDCDLYARFIETDTDISNTISNLNTTEYKLHDTFRGGSGSGYDVSKDPAYDEKTKTIFIDSCTLKSGSTLDLTYGAEQLYVSPITTGSVSGSEHVTTVDTAIAPDYYGSTYEPDSYCSLNVKLIGDMTVKGTLNVGAKVGGYNASSYYSYIIGYYAQIDLNGHDLIIDGGKLFSLGMIKDSVGTGRVIVKNSGKITATLSISDGRGRDQIAMGYSKRQSPFVEYRLPYIQSDVVFYNGTTLEAYCKLYLNELGTNNVYFNVIGTTSNTSLFKWNSSNAEGTIFYHPYQVDALSSPANSTIYKNMYNWRTQFVMKDNIIVNGSLELPVTLTVSTQSVSGTFDLARVDTPIPPFWDIVIESGFNLDVYTKMTFYPGSSFIAKQGSNVNFKPLGSKTYSDISKSVLTVSLTIKGETRYICGGMMAYSNRISDFAANSSTKFTLGVFGQSTYWNYVKPSNIRIEGSVSFDSSINTSISTNDGYYLLSGPINVSSNALASIKNNASLLKTYDAKSELSGGFLYNADYHDLTTQYEKATSYNVNPLISGSKAFIIDSNRCLTGTYSTTTGVFTSDSDLFKYHLWMDNDMYEEGSSSNNQGSKIDRNITIKRVNEELSNKIIRSEDGNTYLYYCGLFVPVLDTVTDGTTYTTLRINGRKFMSNNSSSVYDTNASKYDDITAVFSNNVWRYSKFTNA